MLLQIRGIDKISRRPFSATAGGISTICYLYIIYDFLRRQDDLPDAIMAIPHLGCSVFPACAVRENPAYAVLASSPYAFTISSKEAFSLPWVLR